MAGPFRHILGMRVDAGTYSSATEHIRTWASRAESRMVCVSNVHMTMETVDSSDFRSVVNGADLVTSDGMPLVWMLKALGLGDAERVYGPTLVLHVCAMAEKEGLPIGLYGGTDESLERFRAFLAERYPSLQVAYHYAPPFRPLTEEEDASVVQAIRESGARILFVGIGCPKQEKWMHAHRDQIPVVQLGVGAAFDFHSGAVKQAPDWMGRSGLEWLYRLMREPKRLWRRYVLHNPRFMARASFQLMKHRLGFGLLLLMALAAGWVAPHANAQDGRTFHVDAAHQSASDNGEGRQNEPFETISAALTHPDLAPGDTVLISRGIYRESLIAPIGGSSDARRLVIKARPGHEVIVSGAVPVGEPDQRMDSLWVLNNYVPLDFYGFGESTRYDRELVIADGAALRPVFDPSELVPGTFLVERASRTRARILMNTGSSDTPHLELARHGSLFRPGHEYAPCGEDGTPGWYHIIGITFRHAANQAQTGAVCTGTAGTILQQVRVEWSRGAGIEVIGRHHRLIDVKSNYHGQIGINGRCIYCSLTDVESSYNNRAGHDAFWEAGGGKWTGSRNVRFLRYTAEGNDGPGLWFDGDNIDLSVAFSRFTDNLAAGLFIELNSEGVTVERVTAEHTRRLGWTGAGILIQAAGTATITESLLRENDGAGIWLRLDPRATGGFNTIVNNQFESNAREPGQDRADLQIKTHTLESLCSNRLSSNVLGDSGQFLFEVEEIEASHLGSDFGHFHCLVRYN